MNTSDCSLLQRLENRDHPFVPLNPQQTAAIEQFRIKCDQSVYTFSANPCLCGSVDDVLIGTKDRYLIDVHTKLCKLCGLMRTDPYFDAESLAHFYNNDYRNIYMGTNQATSDFFERQVAHGKNINTFISELGIAPCDTVFEIGCGAGGILKAFQDKGAYVIGCDLGESFLQYGREQGLQLIHGDVEDLSTYAPARLVILSHVLEHFRDPIAELKKIRPLLRKDGYLYVELPGIFWIHKAYRSDVGRYLQNAHVYHFCLQSLDYVLARAGFARLHGTEQIRALYYPSNVSASSYLHQNQQVAQQIIAYLQKLERERWQTELHHAAEQLYRSLRRNVRSLYRYSIRPLLKPEH